MILLIDNGSIHTPDLKKYLKKRKIKFIVAKRNTRIKNLMKHRFKGVILSGGPLRYDSELKIESVNIGFAVVLDIHVPILGICFGHQSIAEVFDGRIKKLPRTVHRTEKIRVTKQSKLFSGLGKSFEMEEFHTDVVSKLPYNFELLAKSRTGIESMKHKNKPIYTIQFHPEASGPQGWQLLDNFMKLCGIKVNS